MGRHVDGHAVDLDGEIGAVVEIEAAQKILVGFAFAGMLGDDQSRHHLQRLAGAGEGLRVHLRAADGHGAGGGGLHVCRPCGRGPRRHAAADLRCNGHTWLNRGWISRASLAAGRLGKVARPRFGWIYRHRGKLVGCRRRGGSGRLPETPWQTDMRRRKMLPKQLYATLMPPHDNCYNRRATASVRLNPASHASKRGMTIQ